MPRVTPLSIMPIGVVSVALLDEHLVLTMNSVGSVIFIHTALS